MTSFDALHPVPDEAQYPSITQEREMFAQLFPVDPIKHQPAVTKYIAGLTNGYREVRYEWSRTPIMNPIPKYNEKQIASGQVTPEDMEVAITHVREDVAEDYFWKASQEFGNLHAREDSIVRLDQEQSIVDDMEQGNPVLVRGFWRIGKTSMVRSIAEHHYKGNSIFLDIGGTSYTEPLPEFQRSFGFYKVANMIAESEHPEKAYDALRADVDDVKSHIEKSGQTPLAFLNDYLASQGRTVFVAIDEVIGLAQKYQDKLRFIGNLRNLPQLRLAVVVHRFGEHEQLFAEAFPGFNSHYIRALRDEEVVRLVEHGLEGTKIQFTDLALQNISQFAGNRPMEVNHLCQALLDPHSQNDFHKKQLIYRGADIAGITESELWKLDSAEGQALHNYERIYKYALTPEERNIVDALVSGKSISVGKADPLFINLLVDTTLLRVDQQRNTYVINGDLLKRVLKEGFDK